MKELKEVSIADMHCIQLQMLKDIDEFCQKNGITYFLTYGTLIGAIRHNGFIPWDDDVDILMPRPDYERFIKEYVSESSFVISPLEDLNYQYLFAKVSDKNTILIEDTSKRTDLGIYIDIFPLDGLPDDEDMAKRHIQRVNFCKKLYDIKRLKAISDYRSWIKNVVLILLKVLLCLLPYKLILNKILTMMAKYDYSSSKNVMEMNFARTNRIVPKSLFEKGIKHVFEDGEYIIPEGYDAYLRIIYGDYMKLPPKEHQKTHHRNIVFYKMP